MTDPSSTLLPAPQPHSVTAPHPHNVTAPQSPTVNTQTPPQIKGLLTKDHALETNGIKYLAYCFARAHSEASYSCYDSDDGGCGLEDVKRKVIDECKSKISRMAGYVTMVTYDVLYFYVTCRCTINCIYAYQ